MELSLNEGSYWALCLIDLGWHSAIFQPVVKTVSPRYRPVWMSTNVKGPTVRPHITIMPKTKVTWYTYVLAGNILISPEG